MGTITNKEPLSNSLKGVINGLLGVIIFSGTLPATRIAVQDLDPFFVTFMRAGIGGILAIILLLCVGSRCPTKAQFRSVIIVTIGVVIGFPLLTGMALQHITSAHSIVLLGLLPLSTAIFGVIRGGERLSRKFWFFSLLGSALVSGFALLHQANFSLTGDGLMLAAVVFCGLGYAEGAALSRSMGGSQVISWALIVALPFMLLGAWYTQPIYLSAVKTQTWVALGYVGIFSMLVGFIFWYKGLACGGIAVVGQLQLLQPFMSLLLAATLLHETVSLAMIVVTFGVVGCVGGARYSQKKIVFPPQLLPKS
jgi:drug/metabolite transporter (DMT)-like permease